MRLRRSKGERGAPEGGPAVEDDAGARRVKRPTVLKRLTVLYDDARYLEVGVQRARTFDRVPAARKVAVDPAFLFDQDAAERQQPGVEYHEVTSDDYFAGLGEEQFDVIYLDGLHTFEQTLRDLLNALDHLQPRGVIVIDDTVPPNDRAAIRTLEDFHAARLAAGSDDKRWSGDVYRLVWFIQTFMPRLQYRSIANNHGQTVVWRRPPGESRTDTVDRLVSDLGTLDYDTFLAEKSVLRLAPYRRIRRELCADLGLDFDR